jgi:DNA-directed RNA polymerase sigma subunit (sigma70/sigma32)
MVSLTKNLTESKIQNSFKKFLDSLSEKEKTVISKRV